MHREIAFFRRTLRSLEVAALHASLAGLDSEIIVVADRPDQATLDWFARHDFGAFARSEVIVVDHGSLGLSRNAGFAAARGTYVLTADADDLVSANAIAASVEAASANAGAALYFPQYYVAFGTETHLYEMHPLSVVTPQGMFAQHPFVSRFLARRADLEGLAYADLRLSAGFAFEDWHFNLEAVAQGLDLRIAPDVTVYYRQRARSLLREMNRMSAGTTGYSDFFSPAVYLPLARRYMEAAAAPIDLNLCTGSLIRERFLSSHLQIEMMLDAAETDPGIDPQGAGEIFAFSNAGCDRGHGVAWYGICERLAGLAFDEILLFPEDATNGNLAYVRAVLDSIHRQEVGRRLLVILSGRAFPAASEERAVTSIDLGEICATLAADAPGLLALRTIQTFAPSARLHMAFSPETARFVERYGGVIQNRICYYRLRGARVFRHGRSIAAGAEFNFLSEFGQRLDLIICDDEVGRGEDASRLEHLATKYEVLYRPIDIDAEPVPVGAGAPADSILWVIPPDSGSQVALLADVAKALARRLPQARIDVLTGATLLESLSGLPNVTARDIAGERPCFGDFGTLVYTSESAGLPQVILDAANAGLSLIAPAIGGVDEFVDVSTGWPIDFPEEGADLSSACVATIVACLSDPEERSRRLRAARERLAARHGRRVFDTAVKEIFVLCAPSNG